MSRRRSPRALAFAVPGLLALAGCSGPPALPSAPPTEDAPSYVSRGAGTLAAADRSPFYPLDLGNQWDYDGSFSVQIVPIGGPPGDPVVIPSSRHLELICGEQRSSGDYVVEHTRLIEEDALGPQTFDSWVRYRQDASGLYEADVATSEPPGCAGGSPAASARATTAAALARAAERTGVRQAAYSAAAASLNRKLEALDALLRSPALGEAAPREGEITRLAYPLHTGARWVIRDDPPFVATVEGTDALTLAAGRFVGRRIRIEIGDLLGPDDRIHFWYSRQGLLLMAAHLTGEATDELGNVVGSMVSEQRLELTGLALAPGWLP